MQEANEKTVFGDFRDAEFRKDGVASLFFRGRALSGAHRRQACLHVPTNQSRQRRRNSASVNGFRDYRCIA
jgi:hypothetical protein